MCKILVIDQDQRPLDPIHPAQARQLLSHKKAAIFRRFPFTLILKESELELPVSKLRLKIDPGAKYTGIALINDLTGEVVFAADCVRISTPKLIIKGIKPLLIAASGYGSRQSCRTDKFGFPIGYCPRRKVHFGFQTGDIVKANIPSGKYLGQFFGRITIRSRPSFSLKTTANKFDVHPKYLRRIHQADGYSYEFQEKWIRDTQFISWW